jgi:hypothetical protein
LLDMNMDEEAFVQETISKNRERLVKHHIAEHLRPWWSRRAAPG